MVTDTYACVMPAALLDAMDPLDTALAVRENTNGADEPGDEAAGDR
jgi:hypothetical protein